MPDGRNVGSYGRSAGRLLKGKVVLVVTLVQGQAAKAPSSCADVTILSFRVDGRLSHNVEACLRHLEEKTKDPFDGLRPRIFFSMASWRENTRKQAVDSV